MGQIRSRLAPVLLAALVAACATEPERPPLQALVFPPPPEEPRFVFERTVRSSVDVQVLDSSARWRQLLTGEGVSGTGLSKPFDITACQGRIFVSDTVRRSILVFDVPQRRFFEMGVEEPGTLRKPLGLATDADCDVYVADGTMQRVVIFGPDGAFKKAIGGVNAFDRLTHVAVDPEGGRIYAVDTGGVDSDNHRVRVFDVASGEHLFDFGARGTENGQFNFPRDIELGADGMLYIVDSGNFRIQLFRKDGTHVRSFGALGRRYGQFARPKGLAVDADTNVYVSDAAFGNFQIFTSEGALLLFVGSRSEKFDRAVYMLPGGIDTDEDGRVYMVDQFFRKFDVYRPFALAEQEGYLGVWNLPPSN